MLLFAGLNFKNEDTQNDEIYLQWSTREIETKH